MKSHLVAYTQALVCAVTCPSEMEEKFTQVACDLSLLLTEKEVEICQKEAEDILANS